MRELGRQFAEVTYQQAEAKCDFGRSVVYEGTEYRRLSEPTPHREVATLFGKITLWRRGYRDTNRTAPEPTLFPIEQALGLVEGATPALAEAAARAMAQAGASQQTTLARLKEEHGVALGVKRLRAMVAEVESQMTPHRRAQQVRQVLKWLEKAAESPGPNKPVLSVGRDGVTLANRPHGCYEVAATATLTVYDGDRHRLGSVYLGYTPESHQPTMSRELTALVKGVLSKCGDTPQLVYLTDAGDVECGYFADVLRYLRHPQTGERLKWRRIIDYYHAASRLTTLGEALFGGGTREAASWAAKMRKVLKKPNGVFRVLHSAAALAARRQLSKSRRKDYQRAYNYLRDRSSHLRYADYRRQGLPIGSGVTEAACKTLFTQRLKLSGMRWSKPGAQTILNLRSILLSGVWQAAYRASLTATPATFERSDHQKAA